MWWNRRRKETPNRKRVVRTEVKKVTEPKITKRFWTVMSKNIKDNKLIREVIWMRKR